MRQMTLLLVAFCAALVFSGLSTASAKSLAAPLERSIQVRCLSHATYEASGIEPVYHDAGTLVAMPGGADAHSGRASSPLVTVQDYVPGGASFQPASTLAAPQTLDLHETGSTDVPLFDGFFGADGPGFADLIDVINLLQHLPVIGTMYRAMTGDTIAPAAQLAGGSLYGGMAGLFAAVGMTFLEEAAGHDLPTVFAGVAPPVESQSTRGLADATEASTSSPAVTGERHELF